mmetsp:Transcript_16121/g.20485  ORF Transcript_16121/g.20485 Transcript_16121/m.20485 type:complete len:82 (+) Transcript_16121:180-425(+)|eukprot:CAMPEP_0170469150 /NCGR_PEP_ID=MMETSP0123-20130129/12079_1 /TAXON_ID=182087 /ORGANISM="Favella ehrenbergii, Strain Fehren 1" /LENGTH=81 /DNA_ID=CAMNT_0010735929 /DNA_START=69 /DNA_END=314 /DNA_ORIENTATION=-
MDALWRTYNEIKEALGALLAREGYDLVIYGSVVNGLFEEPSSGNVIKSDLDLTLISQAGAEGIKLEADQQFRILSKVSYLL